MKAAVTINRHAPWSLDASVSGCGHEFVARSGLIRPDEVAAFIMQHAPEVDAINPTYSECYPGDELYFFSGRDARNYRTEVHVHIWEQ